MNDNDEPTMKIHAKKDSTVLQSMADVHNSWYENDQEGEDFGSEEEEEEENAMHFPVPTSSSVYTTSSSMAEPSAKRQRNEESNEGLTAESLMKKALVPSIVLSTGDDRELVQQLITYAECLQKCALEHLECLNENDNEDSGDVNK